jgi:hypothetical protein
MARTEVPGVFFLSIDRSLGLQGNRSETQPPVVILAQIEGLPNSRLKGERRLSHWLQPSFPSFLTGIEYYDRSVYHFPFCDANLRDAVQGGGK